MKHFKIKALCMAVIAAVLFAVCFSLTAGTTENTADSITAYNLSSWLAKHGISIDRELIDSDTQYVVSAAMKNAVSDRKKAAETILGTELSGTAADTYTGENGTVTFSKDSLLFTPTAGLFKNRTSGIDRYNSGKKAERIAKELGFDLGGSVISSDAENDGFSAVITKTIDSKPVFNDCITIVMNRGGLVSVRGVWYTPESRGEQRAAKSSADALAGLLAKTGGAERIVVRSMTLGYVMEHTGNITKLKPVWRFELDGKDDVYIDA